MILISLSGCVNGDKLEKDYPGWDLAVGRINVVAAKMRKCMGVSPVQKISGLNNEMTVRRGSTVA